MANSLVFLDIDGVVNTLQINRDLKTKYYTEYDRRVGNIQAVLWLNKLCLEQEADIVISSTWRHAGQDICEECLRNSGLDPRIRIIGITPTTAATDTRGKEIRLWLKQHNRLDDNYVILDDDNDMDGLSSHLVKCNSSKGFLGEEYRKATNILRRSNELC